MKDMKFPLTYHQEKDMSHFIYLTSKIFKQQKQHLTTENSLIT